TGTVRQLFPMQLFAPLPNSRASLTGGGMIRAKRGTSFQQAICYGLVGILLQMPAACGEPLPQGGGDGASADHAGCALLEALLEDIDRGLAAVENGTAARRPTTSVTVFAQEALAS